MVGGSGRGLDMEGPGVWKGPVGSWRVLEGPEGLAGSGRVWEGPGGSNMVLEGLGGSCRVQRVQ